jgi:hypothetical protein
LDFINEVIEDVKKSVENLKSSGNSNVEPMINVIEQLARIKSLRVLDIWLDVLADEPENESVNKLYKRIKDIRFVEMEDKTFLVIKNVFTKENKLLYSGYDDLEAWNIVRENKDNHPEIRVEYWKQGILIDTRFAH